MFCVCMFRSLCMASVVVDGCVGRVVKGAVVAVCAPNISRIVSLVVRGVIVGVVDIDGSVAIVNCVVCGS